MKITITKAPEVESKGKWNQLNVYHSSDGKEGCKKLMSFSKKDVYDMMLKAQTGECYNIALKKSEDDKYWNWDRAEKIEGSTGTGNGVLPMPASSNKGTWETKEERDRRQILIIRQSCLSTAANWTGVDSKTPAEVIAIAREFEVYVRGPDSINQEPSITGEEVE